MRSVAEIRAAFKTREYADRVTRIQAFHTIRDLSGNEIPFLLNIPQVRYAQNKEQWVLDGHQDHHILLKSRQWGGTTYEQSDSYDRVVRKADQQILTIAQDEASMSRIYRIPQRLYRNDPVKPKGGHKGNKLALFFYGGRSVFEVGWAGNDSIGRGGTFSKIHASELSSWPHDIERQRDMIAGLRVACKNGQFVAESTARGAHGIFFELWEGAVSGENGMNPIFIGWHDDPNNRMVISAGEFEELWDRMTLDEREQEAEFVQRYRLDDEQIAWLRKTRPQFGRKFDQEYPHSPEVAFLTSGAGRWPQEVLEALGRYVREPRSKELRDQLWIWHYPQEGGEYVIGADTAEGTDSGDYSTAMVVERRTGMQMARFRGKLPIYKFAQYLHKLGKAYNWAYMAPERNAQGISTIGFLVNSMGYPKARMHSQVAMDQRTQKQTVKLGFDTRHETREDMLAVMEEQMHSDLVWCMDPVFLQECRTFIEGKTGKFAAAAGKHDDVVMAACIAEKVRHLVRKAPTVYLQGMETL